MITIVEGARPGRAEADLVVSWGNAPRVAFGGVRGTIAVAREVLGEEVVARALAPRSSGAVLAALPNVIVRRRTLISSFCEVIAELAKERRVAIVIPSVQEVDLDSLACVRPIVAAARRASADLQVIVGREPARAAGSALDRWLATLREAELKVLAALELTRRVDEAPRGREAVALSPVGDAGESAISMAAMEAALDALGFERALEVALALLDRGDLSPEATRRAHAVAGLSILNLDPVTHEASTARLQDAHFKAALEGETAALTTAHYAYRRCVTHVRNLRDPESALRFGDLAVEAASGSDDPRAPFFEAWARNGRAFARLRSGLEKEAEEDCERAAELLSTDGLELVLPAIEVGVARVLVRNNRGHVARAAGDREAHRRARAATEAALLALPANERPAPQWLSPPDDERDLAVLLAYWKAALAEAERRLDPHAEAHAAHALGVLAYRLGDAKLAHQGFVAARRRLEALGIEEEGLFGEALNVAVAAYRAELWEDAKAGFEALLKSPLAEGDAQAELGAALAMVTAASGDPARAEALSEHAAALSLASLDLGVRARVLRSLAEVARMRGDRARASVLAQEGLDLEVALAPEDRFGLLVVRLENGAFDPVLLEEALSLVAAALGDVNAWWDVERLAPHASRAANPGAREVLELLDAAKQREDARASSGG